MKGPGLARMAWRNLWRNRRRTILTLSSIAFGVMLAWIFTGIGDRQWREMIDVAARMGGGHVTLQHPEYLDTPTLSRTVRTSELMRVAANDHEVQRAVTRISGQLMLSTAEQNYGAGFIAFDPDEEDETTLALLEAIDEGDRFRSRDDPGILLGRRLGENLGAKLGRKVVFTMTDKNGEIVRDVARVRGFIRTGSPSIDSSLSLLTLDRAREVLGYEADESIQVALFIGDQRAADRVAARLGGLVGPETQALAWHSVQPDLSAFITMKVAGARFMEIIIMLLVAAGIFNTLFVSVMERLREFGIMLALGFSPGRLFRLVMLESLWVALLGLVLGVLVTAGPYYYLSTVGIDVLSAVGVEQADIAGVAMPSVIRAGIYPQSAIMIAAAALLATLLAGLYPAWRASSVEPVESIRLV